MRGGPKEKPLDHLRKLRGASRCGESGRCSQQQKVFDPQREAQRRTEQVTSSFALVTKRCETLRPFAGASGPSFSLTNYDEGVAGPMRTRN